MAVKIECKSCKWWESFEEEDVVETGGCRKHAPQHVLGDFDPNTDCGSLAVWPDTMCCDWCGDYEERN